MSGYILSPLAAQDLDDIWEFIAYDNLDAADREWVYDRQSSMLTTHYEQVFDRLAVRFRRMTRQLTAPYREARLPTLLTPEELIDWLFA